MKKNDEIVLTIHDLGTDGQGIGKYEGAACFVSGALPGERVRAHIIKVKKNYAVCKLKEIIIPSPMRVKAHCGLFLKCGGCQMQELEYFGQLEWKKRRVEDCLGRIGELNDVEVIFPLPSKNIYRYRNKASFPVRKEDGKTAVGLYAYHSHFVVDIDDCLIQYEEVKIVMSQLRVWITKYEVPIYDEQTGEGLLRHVVVRCAKDGTMMLILVINGEEVPNVRQLLMLFNLALPKVKSIILNHNTKNTNVILGERCTTLYGRDYYLDEICGLEFKVSPDSFLQVNLQQTEALYNSLFKMLKLTKKDTVIDLFCGVGTITLNAAKRAKFAYGIEISEQSVENARFSARLNDVENTRFEACDAYKIGGRLNELKGEDRVVIVDPPRKGLTEKLIEEITAVSPKKIGYVSCDPATLARDLKQFAAFGYNTKQVQPVDMFPQTGHVESVCVLEK